MRGSFGQFGMGSFNPIYDTSEKFDPVTGQYARSSEYRGGMTGLNPFNAGFSNSFGAMQGLGNTISNAFGQANAMNLMSAEKQRDRNMISDLLDKMFGKFSFNASSGPGGMSAYGDYSSRQTSGGYR